MILYHMSDTLKIGDVLISDFKHNQDLVEPFVKALNVSIEMFLSLLLNAEYFGSVLAKYGLKGMPTHEVKWATEGIFEFVRRNEFPEQCSRIQCNYFYPDLKLCKELYKEDWGNAPKEERANIRLFEVEAEGRIASYDMRLFDEAFDHLYDYNTAEDVKHCIELARMYFCGERSRTPVMEILCDGTAIAKKRNRTGTFEITDCSIFADQADHQKSIRGTAHRNLIYCFAYLRWRTFPFPVSLPIDPHPPKCYYFNSVGFLPKFAEKRAIRGVRYGYQL